MSTRVFLSTVVLVAVAASHAAAVDTSPAPFLQWFEASYETILARSPDLFHAGYGAVWTPPPYRGDTSDLTVGYDVYDRFDLGQWNKRTLYGTKNGLQQVSNTLHRAGKDLHVDFVMNHNGYSSLATPGFYDAGGYPGLSITEPYDIDGDFHSAYWGGPEYERLAGLIDIAQEKNYRFIRNPVDPNDPRNIRAGTTPAFGRIANVPDPNNRQFYPDIGHNTIYVYDPVTGEQNIPVHQFNQGDPLAGDAVEENAMGHLMRSAQWLVQVAGVDGLRIDAGKHMQGFAFDYFDRAVYRSNPRTLLDGSPQHVFSYSEVFDANPAILLPHVKKDIDPGDIGRIGGNRDTLDFKWYFAVKDSLENYGQAGAWFNVKDAGLDVAHNGLHDGSAGVKFTSNHDVYKPYKLENVANALMMMMPGNAAVYFNGKEFGDNRDFPKDGRQDSLSVGAGSVMTDLVRIRETHGRGDYQERWVDNEGIYIFERTSNALVGLSNRGDGGWDERTVRVDLAPGTHLIELTGNAANSTVDPFNDISEVLTVWQGNDGNYVTMRVPRNLNPYGDEHQRGYVIYGLGTPHADNGLELSGTNGLLPGDTNITNNYENGVKRQSDVHVVTADSFQVRLQTSEVRHLGLDTLRDIWADGDSALLKLDGGRDVNGNGYVDVTAPGNVAYGFEYFGEKYSPLIGSGGLGGPRGDGEFLQTVDTTQLEEGYHYLEARAFRHRTDGGPPVFSTWKQVVYVDRLAPVSGIAEFSPFGGPGDVDTIIESLDFTANNVHVFLNLHESVSDSDIYSYISGNAGAPDLSGYGGGAERVDVNLFKFGYLGVAEGNNVFTIVSYEPTGTSSIQRLTGVDVGNGRGSGLGDLNHDWQLLPSDVNDFEGVLYSEQNNNAYFNPSADVNGDGRVDTYDLLSLGDVYATAGAGQSVLDEHRDALLRRGNVNQQFGTDAWDIDYLYANLGASDWLLDLDGDGVASLLDVDLLVHDFFSSDYGDTDLDGVITIADFHGLRDNFGTFVGWAFGNFNGNGVVDFGDFMIQRDYFLSIGDTNSVAEMEQWLVANRNPQIRALAALLDDGATERAGVATPEPSTGHLLMIAATMFAWAGSGRIRKRMRV